MEEKVKKVRPYWHVDMKWITGIFLLISLSLSIALFNLYKLSGPEHAIDLTTYMVASAFSRKGLDDTSEIEEFKQKLIASGGSTKPIPTLDITVTLSDIEGKSPREGRLWMFRKIVEPIYYEGAEGAKKLILDPEMKDNIEGRLGFYRYLNEKTHQKIGSFFYISAIVSAILLGFFVFFSAGAGRFLNPGLIFLLVGVPGVLFSLILKIGDKKKPVSTEPAQNIGQMASGIMKLIGPQISGLVLKPYLYLALSGLALIIAAIVFKIVKRIRRDRKNVSK